MGDADKADPEQIPDFSCMDPGLTYVGQHHLHVHANYVPETDNILDLSHIEFLHPGTPGSPGVKDAVTRVKQLSKQVTSYRSTINDHMCPSCTTRLDCHGNRGRPMVRRALECTRLHADTDGEPTRP